jgi:hypothetical protein
MRMCIRLHGSYAGAHLKALYRGGGGGQEMETRGTVSRVETEPVLLNVYGAPELMPRNEFRQPMEPGGPVR